MIARSFFAAGDEARYSAVEIDGYEGYLSRIAQDLMPCGGAPLDVEAREQGLGENSCICGPPAFDVDLRDALCIVRQGWTVALRQLLAN
jgi:hypothetical protein